MLYQQGYPQRVVDKVKNPRPFNQLAFVHWIRWNMKAHSLSRS
jgi:hypothetical protein